MTVKEFNNKDFETRKEIVSFWAKNLTTQRARDNETVFVLCQYRNLFLEVIVETGTNRYVDCKAISFLVARENYNLAMLED